jgi:thiol-disulfide isomerase/thioredoxin
LYKNVSDKEPGENKFIYLVVAYLGTALALYVFFPFCPCKDSRVGKEAVSVSLMIKSSGRNSENVVTDDSNVANPDNSMGMGTSANGNTLSASNESGPKKARSRYGDYTTFGSQVVDLDEGKKIVCLFSAGCDHCMEAAREITALSKKISLPPVYILFMDEETEKIPSFFKVANATYPYKILDVPVFWELMGSDANTPAVILLWNGNVIKYYEGIESNKFDVADLETACKSF